MFGPLLFLCLSVCREMNAVGARIPDEELDTEDAGDADNAGDADDAGDNIGEVRMVTILLVL